ncbi:MAG: AtpZ/AtpI family protein [Deltaproteobacteria bacterium]|nr:AtpZ/AtpI family protein [Deltaproteobacteria bacterium]MBI4196704.1 AtpZ/AtpI family protein [Deltaproteobacteria bacterium]
MYWLSYIKRGEKKTWSYGENRVKEPGKKGDSFLIAWGIYGAIGFQLAATVVGGLLLGGWLDKRWGMTPWLTLVGLLIGSTGGFYNLIRMTRWNERRKQSP